jgi:hypothetical protein
MLRALQGEGEDALKYTRKACESPRSFGHTHHTMYQVSCVYSVLGLTEQALAWLDRAVSTGFRCWPMFRTDPCLTNLRKEPEFENYVAAIEKESRNIPILHF